MEIKENDPRFVSVEVIQSNKGLKPKESWGGNELPLHVADLRGKYASIELPEEKTWKNAAYITMESALSVAMALFAIVEKNRPDLLNHDD